MKYFAVALRRLVMFPFGSVVTTSNLNVFRLVKDVVFSGVEFGDVVGSGVELFMEVVVFGVVCL